MMEEELMTMSLMAMRLVMMKLGQKFKNRLSSKKRSRAFSHPELERRLSN